MLAIPQSLIPAPGRLRYRDVGLAGAERDDDDEPRLRRTACCMLHVAVPCVRVRAAQQLPGLAQIPGGTWRPRRHLARPRDRQLIPGWEARASMQVRRMRKTRRDRTGPISLSPCWRVDARRRHKRIDFDMG